MQTEQRHMYEILTPDGNVMVSDMKRLKEIVEQYPYFHLARLCLLRLLYQQRDPSFNAELRRSALYLPSRETMYAFIEGDSMRPKAEKAKPGFFGATQARKNNERVAGDAQPAEENRTTSLIDSFLGSLPSDVRSADREPASKRRPRVDARVDYISYMLAEEEASNEAAQGEASTDAEPVVVPSTDNNAELIDNFIQNQGDRRICLTDKKDNELQKPVLEAENTSSQGAFTETLARIYIKQGKFEHAIEIIRRLSLKYPKKNRYFADQIRFLEKLIANQNALKS